MLHWHDVGVEQPRRVKHELDDVRGASNFTSGHTELIERATNVPTSGWFLCGSLVRFCTGPSLCVWCAGSSLTDKASRKSSGV